MKIKDEVLVVLSRSTCEGNAFKLPTEPRLKRKLYVDTSKVLEALGGKWNRKAQAHLFDGEAQPLIDTAITTGEVTTAREIGFFETPEELASALCAMADVREDMSCLEPSAGLGRIVRAMMPYRPASIDMVEFDPGRYAKLAERIEPWALAFSGTRFTVIPDDFMAVELDSLWGAEPVDRVVMNPPFCRPGQCGRGDHLDHVRHAFELLKPGGRLVSVLPVSVEFRQDRRHTTFRDWYGSLGGETVQLPEGAFKSSGTSVRTCVLRLDKD